jgi:hypothetical protein
MATVTYSNEDLNRFWLRILGDGALIILNALSPKEAEAAKQVRALAERFDSLALRSNENPTAEQMVQINKEAFQTAQDFRMFLLLTAKKFLTEDFHLDVKPSLLNNYVNETERYLDLLNTFMQNRKPVFDQIREEIFWLPVFTHQTYYIASNVGYYQKENREKAQNYTDILNEFWAFSMELDMMSLIGTGDFPMAREHHRAVVNVLNDYYEFLTSLIALQKRATMPGSLPMLYLDRSRRIVCFYLREAAVFLDSEAPDCDPYAQRISSL